MTDLETRVRDALTDHASAAGEWRVSGSDLRVAAAGRASTQRRTAALAAVAAAVVAVAGVALGTGGARDSAPPPGVTDSPTSGPTTAVPRPELLRVRVADEVVQKAVVTFGLGDAQLLATATLPGSGDTLLVFRDRSQVGNPSTVVNTVSVHGDQLLAGTLTLYRPGDDLVAQPARDGTGATLVVIAPPDSDADELEVTTSVPGQEVQVETGSLYHGLALVPLPSAQSATRLRLLRQGTTVTDSIPGDYHLGESVPRPLERVVAETGEYDRVQVRTDGQTACRVTVTDLDGLNPFFTPWNPIDEGCTTIDNEGLQLLAPDDRRYSSVAGLAPAGTDVVTLFWRVGKDTESLDMPVTRAGGAIAFIDTSGHRPDQLIRAEAWSRQGEVLATALPRPAP